MNAHLPVYSMAFAAERPLRLRDEEQARRVAEATNSPRSAEPADGVNRLLKQNSIRPQAHASHVALLRQRFGAALVRAQERFARVARRTVSEEASTMPGQGQQAAIQ
jgi:hypothetical protein